MAPLDSSQWKLIKDGNDLFQATFELFTRGRATRPILDSTPTPTSPWPLIVDIPGPVIGKGRPKVVRRAHLPYPIAITPDKTVSAENRIAHELGLAWGRPPVDCALALKVDVRVPVPASKSKKFRLMALIGAIHPVGRPDLDNVLKLICDAGNKVVWTDDSRFASVSLRRIYSETPGLTLTIAPLSL